MKRFICLLSVMVLGASMALAQQVTKENVPGIGNFNKVESVVACAGAIKPESAAAIKKEGFVAIFNLREATEAGADLEAEAAAAKAAGINYVHIPLNSAKPDPAAADQFLKAIMEKGNQPAFIHCASGNRASAMWLIKRVLVDKWDNDKAMAEATALGLTSPVLKTFALDYIQKHK